MVINKTEREHSFELSNCTWFSQVLVIILIIALNSYTYSLIIKEGDLNSEAYLLSIGGLCWSYFIGNHDISAFLTSAFLHSSLSHLIINMFLFSVVSYRVSKYLGAFKILAIYLFSILAGGIISCVAYATMNQNVVTLGASNGILGLGAALVLVTSLYKKRKECIISVCFLLILLVLSFNGADIMGHIGGIASGFIASSVICILPRPKMKRKRVIKYAICVLETVCLIIAVFKIYANVNGNNENYIYNGDEIGARSQCIGVIDKDEKYIVMQIDYSNLGEKAASFKEKYNYKMLQGKTRLSEVSILKEGYLPDSLIGCKESKLIQICFRIENEEKDFIFSLYTMDNYKIGDMGFTLQDVVFKSIDEI